MKRHLLLASIVTALSAASCTHVAGRTDTPFLDDDPASASARDAGVLTHARRAGDDALEASVFGAAATVAALTGGVLQIGLVPQLQIAASRHGGLASPEEPFALAAGFGALACDVAGIAFGIAAMEAGAAAERERGALTTARAGSP